jgi:hypothetical protein
MSSPARQKKDSTIDGDDNNNDNNDVVGVGTVAAVVPRAVAQNRSMSDSGNNSTAEGQNPLQTPAVLARWVTGQVHDVIIRDSVSANDTLRVIVDGQMQLIIVPQGARPGGVLRLQFKPPVVETVQSPTGAKDWGDYLT